MFEKFGWITRLRASRLVCWDRKSTRVLRVYLAQKPLRRSAESLAATLQQQGRAISYLRIIEKASYPIEGSIFRRRSRGGRGVSAADRSDKGREPARRRSVSGARSRRGRLATFRPIIQHSFWVWRKEEDAVCGNDFSKNVYMREQEKRVFKRYFFEEIIFSQFAREATADIIGLENVFVWFI